MGPQSLFRLQEPISRPTILVASVTNVRSSEAQIAYGPMPIEHDHETHIVIVAGWLLDSPCPTHLTRRLLGALPPPSARTSGKSRQSPLRLSPAGQVARSQTGRRSSDEMLAWHSARRLLWAAWIRGAFKPPLLEV